MFLCCIFLCIDSIPRQTSSPLVLLWTRWLLSGSKVRQLRDKNCKKGLILSFLQANNLICHRFMDAGKRHKTPRSETRDNLLLITGAVAKLSAFLCWFPRPSSHREIQRGPGDTCTHWGLYYRRGIFNFTNLNLF